MGIPADANNDGAVTLGEWYEFVKERTASYVKEQFKFEQTPTCHFGKYGADDTIWGSTHGANGLMRFPNK